MARLAEARAPFLALFAAALALALGHGLYGAPAPVDELTPWWHQLGAFLIFAFWAGSVLAWGRVLAGLCRVNEILGPAGPFALGTAGASLAAIALGHVGLIGPRHALPLGLLTLGGPALLCLRRDWPGLSANFAGGRRKLRWDAENVATVFALALVAFFILSALLGASAPLGGEDEYRYSLIGPRLWSDAGRVYRPNLLPSAFFASFWENLFVWGDSFLGGPQGRGLIEGQLFARWTHVVFGYLGCALALRELLRAFAPDAAWLALAVAAAFADLSMSWTAWEAKNDWGVALWALAAAAILLSPRRLGRRPLAAAGALAGLAVIGKYTTAFFAVAFFAGRAVARRKEKPAALARSACLFGGAALAAAAPILLRNWVFVGNPVFTVLDEFFRDRWIGPRNDLLTRFFYEVPGLSLNVKLWWEKLAGIPHSCPLSALALLFPLPLAFLPGLRKLRPLLLPALGAIALFLLKTGPGFGDTVRLLGPTLLVLAGAGVLMLAELTRASGIARSFSLTIGSLALAACAWRPLDGAAVPWQAWTGLFELPAASLVVRDHQLAGDSKAWLRAHAADGSLIVTTGDDFLYYVSYLKVTDILEQPELGWETMTTWSPLEMLKRIRATGAVYLLDSTHWNGRPWGTTSVIMRGLLARHPEAILFQGRDSVVADLAGLEGEVFRACLALDPLAAYPGPGPEEPHDLEDPLNHFF